MEIPEHITSPLNLQFAASLMKSAAFLVTSQTVAFKCVAKINSIQNKISLTLANSLVNLFIDSSNFQMNEWVNREQLWRRNLPHSRPRLAVLGLRKRISWDLLRRYEAAWLLCHTIGIFSVFVGFLGLRKKETEMRRRFRDSARKGGLEGEWTSSAEGQWKAVK